MVNPSRAQHWILRMTVKGRRNSKGAPLRPGFGIAGAGVVTLNLAHERALEYRRLSQFRLDPRCNALSIKAVLNVARSAGFRGKENPVTSMKEGKVLPEVQVCRHQHNVMPR